MSVQQTIKLKQAELLQAADPPVRCQLLVDLLELYIKIPSPDSEAYMQELKELAPVTSNDRFKGWALFYEGIEHRQHSQMPAAINLITQALDLFKQLGDDNSEAMVALNLGICYRNIGKYNEALSYYNQALEHAANTNNKSLLSSAHNNSGNVYMLNGNYAAALHSQLSALRIRREIDDKPGMAASLRNIGNLFFKQKHHAQALQNYQESLQLSTELNDVMGIAASTYNLGVIFDRNGEMEHALESYLRAYHLYKQLNVLGPLAIVMNSLGIIHKKLGKQEEAGKWSTEAITTSIKAGDRHGEGFARTYHAQLLKEQGLYAKAIAEAEAAVAIYQEIGSKDNLNTAYLVISEAYEALGNTAKALQAYKAFHQTDAEVLGKDASERLTQLNFQHEMERKEAVHKATEDMLHNILPVPIANRILRGDKQIADMFEQVSVFFCDIAGFTKLSQNIAPTELVNILNDIFSEFDRLAVKHGLEKIKTIGDSYMAVAGIPSPLHDHAERAAAFALDVLACMQQYRLNTGRALEIRAGLHCGHAVAGVIGKNKYAYDLWGDTVNTASRMESHSIENKIQVSEAFRNLIAHKFSLQERGEIEVKGKGKMRTWFLVQ